MTAFSFLKNLFLSLKHRTVEKQTGAHQDILYNRILNGVYVYKFADAPAPGVSLSGLLRYSISMTTFRFS